MRTSKITIDNTEYTLCLSTRAVIELQERGGGDLQSALNHILESGSIKDTFSLLADMIEAGAVYDEKNGKTAHRISYDDIVDLVGIDDYSTMFERLTEAISVGTETTVEAKSKNAIATEDN